MVPLASTHYLLSPHEPGEPTQVRGDSRPTQVLRIYLLTVTKRSKPLEPNDIDQEAQAKFRKAALFRTRAMQLGILLLPGHSERKTFYLVLPGGPITMRQMTSQLPALIHLAGEWEEDEELLNLVALRQQVFPPLYWPFWPRKLEFRPNYSITNYNPTHWISLRDFVLASGLTLPDTRRTNR
jgi:hypothetical protein